MSSSPKLRRRSEEALIRQAQKQARRRAEIVRVAKDLFAQSGLSGTSIAEIAAEAGLSHGLMYHYFPSKEAVYLATACEALEHIEAAVRDCVRTAEQYSATLAAG